jgi:protease I
MHQGAYFMADSLKGYKVAILAVDGFEQAELVEPQKALKAAGAQVHVISQKPGQIQGFVHTDKGDKVTVDATFDQTHASDYDAVVLPGGVVNGDAIRVDAKAQNIVKQFDKDGKPIAVICHGGWLPISAGIVSGRTLTSWPTLQDDIRNAGGTWVDEEVHRDRNLITSRKPDDLPAFNKVIIEALSERKKAA